MKENKSNRLICEKTKHGIISGGGHGGDGGGWWWLAAATKSFE